MKNRKEPNLEMISPPKRNKRAFSGDSALPSFCGSKLIRLLSDAVPPVPPTAGIGFVDRFGDMIGLPGSLSLSRMHAELATMELKPVSDHSLDAGVTVREAFISTRSALLSAIDAGFASTSGYSKEKLPSADGLHAHFQFAGVYAAKRFRNAQTHAAAFEPYRKFYMAHQRNMEMRIQRLRSFIGTRIAGLSPKLTRIGKMDACLAEILSSPSRELLGVIPKHLERRFGKQFDEHGKDLPKEPTASDLTAWIQPGGWISDFCDEMRELLLAELEVRLQPVLGLIDSLPRPQIGVDNSSVDRKGLHRE